MCPVSNWRCPFEIPIGNEESAASISRSGSGHQVRNDSLSRARFAWVGKLANHWLTKKLLYTILLLSLCAHFAIAIISRHGVIKDDSESYVLIETNLAQDNGYVFQPRGIPTAWRGPGYPVMLAGIFKLTRTSYEAVRFVQAFLWVGIALCAWKVASMLFGPDAALMAAAIAGFYPEFLGFTGLLRKRRDAPHRSTSFGLAPKGHSYF